MAIECARRIDYLDSLCRELGLEVKQAGNKLRKDDYVRALRNHFLLEKYGSIDNIPWSMKFMLSIECLQLCRRIQTLKESDQQKVWEWIIGSQKRRLTETGWLYYGMRMKNNFIFSVVIIQW